MSDATFLIGLFIVLLGGVCQGAFLLPSKWMRDWEWENYWAIFALSAYLICPLIVAFSTVPNLLDIYSTAPTNIIVITILFGFAWAVGAVLFGLGADALGLALGFAIILGIAATSGTLIPLLIDTPEGFTATQGWVTAISLIVMLIGVVTCSFAGRWQEQQESGNKAGNYRKGVILCVSSGLLAASGGLGFAFGEPLYASAISEDLPAHVASNALLPILMPPMFLINAGYAIFLMTRNKTADRYRRSRSGINTILALIMGIIWLAGMALYGNGANQMGPLGTSLGWSILLSSMIIVANVLGVLSGEWKGAPRKSFGQLLLGLMILLVAVAGLGYANYLQEPSAQPISEHTDPTAASPVTGEGP